MSQPSILQRITKGSAAAGPSRALLGACGKHRSYREHFDDLDKQPDLVAIKELLYDRGIREAVDRGVWKDVQGTADFVPFGHTMIGRRPSGDWVYARIVASPDLVGRDDYPLVLFALVRSAASAMTLARDVLSRLAALEAAIGDADSLPKVQDAIAAARHSLADHIAIGDVDPGVTPAMRPALARLAKAVAIGVEPVGLTNALYQLDRRFGLFEDSTSGRRPTGKTSFGAKTITRALHMRVPTSGLDSQQTSPDELIAWNDLIAEEVGPQIESLAALCDADARFVDVVVGTPASSDFHFLHASAAKLPAIDQIPYEIDPPVAARIADRIALRAGQLAVDAGGRAGRASVGTAPNVATSDNRGSLSQVLLGHARENGRLLAIAAAAVVLIVVAAALMFSKP